MSLVRRRVEHVVTVVLVGDVFRGDGNGRLWREESRVYFRARRKKCWRMATTTCNDGPFFERVVIFRRFWLFARAKTTVTDLVWLAGEASVSEWGLSAGYADESAIGEGRE